MPRAATTTDAPQQTAHMVVVGHFTGLTDTHVEVTFPALSGDRTLSVKRTDLRASGSTGVAVPGSPARAVSFACAVCPTCNNVPADRRSVSFSTDNDGNEVRTVTKCDGCDGKGHISDFGTDTPVIDPDHADIVDHLSNGNLPPGAEPVFRSMQSGGRSGRVDQWDVEITARPLMAMTPSGVPVPVSPLIVQHFNEAYASDDMPHGAPIGRTKTGTYATVQHRTALQPFIDHCEAAGLPYTAWGANRGQDAYVDIMLAENGTKEEVIANLKALSQAAGNGSNTHPSGAFGMSGLRENPDAIIRFGIQIHHTFDGAFTVRGIAERVACLNGMVATNAEDLLSVQHKKGVMDRINWSGMAPLLADAALRLYTEMQNVVRMNLLPLAPEDWEALLVLAEQRGILSWPSLGQNNQLTGGRVFRAAAQGWQNPALPWVAVGGNDGDVVGSLNHALNVFTGIITHQVEAHDAHGRVTGGKAISVARTQDMLQRVHMLMREVQDNAEAAAAEAGASDDVGSWVFHHGIPMLTNVAHEDADEGHILPRITVNPGQDNERSVQLLSAIPTA